jgi:MoaA/NifB/PqqE/SkfB family radical SAM enzyme
VTPGSGYALQSILVLPLYIFFLDVLLAQHGDLPDLRCYAGLLMVRLDPWGHVYPCLEQRVRVGSVREQDFSTVWQSELLRDVRTELRADRRCKCWFNNTAMINHYSAVLQ